MSEQGKQRRDFDTWARVAKEDPEGFEAMRRAAIEDFLQTLPPENRERMRRLQWRIDQERKLAHSPMSACIRLSRMMWEHVLGEGGLRDRLHRLGHGMAGDEMVNPPRTAEVVTLGRD